MQRIKSESRPWMEMHVTLILQFLLKELYVSIRGTLSRWNFTQVEDGWLRSPGRQLHLPLGGETGICPYRWWCKLPDLGLSFSFGCPQRYRFRTYRGSAHLQKRYEDDISPHRFHIWTSMHRFHQVKSSLLVHPIHRLELFAQNLCNNMIMLHCYICLT